MRACLLASLLAVAAGNLCAVNTLTLTCGESLLGAPSDYLISNGAVGSNGCFQTSFINASVTDSLDWGDPSTYLNGIFTAPGESGLGAASQNNNYTIGVDSGPDVRTPGGMTMKVEKPPTILGANNTVTRVDDFAVEYSTVQSKWTFANTGGTPNLVGLPLHFDSNQNAPGATAPASPTAAGDQLLEMPTGGGIELLFLDDNYNGVWFQIASVNNGTNALFVAVVQAYDIYGTLIGSYTLTEGSTGTGTNLVGTGGTCAGLSHIPPTPCNDAVDAGFYDPQGRIRSIYISVFDPSNLTIPIGFAIDSLLLEPVPEPVMPLMIGGGLAALALYGRKRRSRAA